MVSATENASEKTPWTDRDREVLSKVEQALASGIELKRWWEKTDADNTYAGRFELSREFNQSETSFGFFDKASVGSRPVPVMGVVEDLLFDQARQPVTRSVRDEVREFVLRYFMRITAFRLPQAASEKGFEQAGFGYSQRYYKLKRSGVVGKFSESEEFAIVDLREIGSKYDWIVARVRLFDFTIAVQPFGDSGPEASIPLNEDSYLVLTADFITNRESPDATAEYGLGYAFLSGIGSPGVIAYGPGHFEVAFQLINFRLLNSGETRVRLVFAANQPTRLLKVSLNPIDWALRMTDLMSFGMSGRVLNPLKQAVDSVPGEGLGLDLPASWISSSWLDKRFLLQHFQQHYQMITGALLTWRRIPNWLDHQALPEWVRTGRSS